MNKILQSLLLILIISVVSCREDDVVPGSNQFIDTLTYYDTMIVNDTLIVSDTLYVRDTVLVTDTTWIIDTLSVLDTIIIQDTLVIFDTLLLQEVNLDDWELFGDVSEISVPASMFNQEVNDELDYLMGTQLFDRLDSLYQNTDYHHRIGQFTKSIHEKFRDSRRVYKGKQLMARIPRIKGRYDLDSHSIIKTETFLYINERGYRQVLQFTRTFTHEYFELFTTEGPFYGNVVPLYVNSSAMQTLDKSEGIMGIISSPNTKWKREGGTLSIIQSSPAVTWVPVDPFDRFMINSTLTFSGLNGSFKATDVYACHAIPEDECTASMYFEGQWSSDGSVEWKELDVNREETFSWTL